MKRRNFLKFASSMAAAKALPVGLGMSLMAQRAYAASPNYSAVNVALPSVMPQIINIFMYGGASELAGNLTNIVDINNNSMNDYSAGNAFGSGILTSTTDSGQITANDFWANAGGTHMEEMLAADDMAVYRTIYKQKSPTRSHRESIYMSHKGTIDIENAPGIGSRLALMMMENASSYAGATMADGSMMGSLDNLTLPFVSFEGDSQTFALDPLNTMPLYLRGLTMDDQFNNPYSRGSIGNSEDSINTLLQTRLAQIESSRNKYSSAWNGFDKRDELEGRMADLSDLLEGTDDNGNLSSAALLGITYPNTSFGRQLESAITLAIHNPQTLYMAVGTPGLGGWDDHNNGIDRYPDRMDQLMEAVKVGMAHINASNGVTTLSGNTRSSTNNIVINVMGDFGRLVNLNGSGGWDHANNQNLYTFGGADVRPVKEAAAMGTVVGNTARFGTSKTNNQYTVPTTDSPTWEPMSVASSIYGYFGATNPNIMTASPDNEDGDVRLEDNL
jgi:hypothetical protein